jgi:hypothetical protein
MHINCDQVASVHFLCFLDACNPAPSSLSARFESARWRQARPHKWQFEALEAATLRDRTAPIRASISSSASRDQLAENGSINLITAQPCTRDLIAGNTANIALSNVRYGLSPFHFQVAGSLILKCIILRI